VVIGLEASPEGEFFVSQLYSGNRRFLYYIVMPTLGAFSRGIRARPFCYASASYNRTATNLLNSTEELGLIFEASLRYILTVSSYETEAALSCRLL
jgi:hypothetical protein